MGIASLILGIISILTGWIPFVCFITIVIAIIGLILGIVDTIKKSKIPNSKKGVGIAGIATSAIAIPIIFISSLISFVALGAIIESSDSILNDYNRHNSIFDDYYTDRYYDWDYDDYYYDSIKYNIKNI